MTILFHMDESGGFLAGDTEARIVRENIWNPVICEEIVIEYPDGRKKYSFRYTS
jgi:hypothetical protein